MILIADSGSTKTEWLISIDSRIQKCLTQGLHPLFLSDEKLMKIIETELDPNFKQNISKLFFYGAGCHGEERRMRVRAALIKIFPNTDIEVNSDILGAARATCNHKAGLVCILGTGSSVCHYNGKIIETIRPSLGYVLGDEGSGNHIGKKLLSDFFTGKMTDELHHKFENKYSITRESVVESLYKGDFPNRYLASFALFAHEHMDTVYCKKLVKDCILEMFDHHILPLYNQTKLPVNFNGSIAFIFRETIEEICRAKHLELGKVIQSPGERLVEFHRG